MPHLGPHSSLAHHRQQQNQLPVNTGGAVGGTPTQLVLTTQPSGATDGSVFAGQPVVEVRDVVNVLVSSANNSVMAAVASGAGTLSGTTRVAAVNGVSTFTNLTIAGTGAHTLNVSSAGLSADTSSVFTVGTTSSEPSPSGTIIWDSRAGGVQDFQSITSVSGFKTYLTNSGGELTNPGESNTSWSFTTDYDGNGKNAVAIYWPVQVAESSAPNIFYFNASYQTIYTSMVIHLGRTATGGGVGSVGSFIPITPAGGMKRFHWYRVKDSGTHRLYWVWGAGSGTGQALQIDDTNLTLPFNASFGIGSDVRWTFQHIAGATSTCRVWRDGVLTYENLNANILSDGFAQFEFPTTRFATGQAETEYWTDLVVWSA